ncbi:hypothetical protein ABZX12_17680 [Kribbella sp. NPDC003505]|uniref:TolB family protein n=1 Tax=Kribbella sp. NPDC003505 TaxID=3154448 RepID=UPI0033A1A3BF
MKSTRRWSQTPVCLLLLTAITACDWRQSGAANEIPSPPGTRLNAPDGEIAVIVWLPDGHIYFHGTPNLDTPYRLMRIAPGQAAEPVDLPQVPGCRRTDYLLPHRLPDGRLGLARKCITDDSESTGFTLIAYDPASGRIEDLAPLGKRLPTGVSRRRDLDSGYLSHGSGICDGFAPITRRGIGDLPGPVTLDGHTWRLDEIFRQKGSDSCRDQGRAGWAVLSPDNRQLIFAAAPDAQGDSGQSRTDAPSQIYRQDLPNGPPRKLASGFTALLGMEISPDGRSLAVAGGRSRERGVWLIDLSSGSMRKVADGPLKYPSFSPDGGRLALVFSPDLEMAQLRVLDVPK